jgi:hypothetical protein
MAGIMYYASGPTGTVSLDLAKRWGLGHAFAESPFAREVKSHTPDGNDGLIFGDEARLKPYHVLMRMEEQEWRRLPDRDGRPPLWIGWWKESPPTPDALARKRQLPGPEVSLADGAMWKIPLVRRFDGSREQWDCFLPCLLAQDAAGKITKGEVVKAYAELWKATAAAWEATVENRDLPDAEVLAALGLLVATNYVIGAEEFLALGLLSEQLDHCDLVLLGIDYFSFAAFAAQQKKTSCSPSLPESATGGTTISAGAGDLLLDTPPPEPTSRS